MYSWEKTVFLLSPHWTSDTMQMRMHWESMLVRHLDEVSLAKIFLNWEK